MHRLLLKNGLLLLLLSLPIVLNTSFLQNAQKPRKAGVATLSDINHYPRTSTATKQLSFYQPKYRTIDGTRNNLWYPNWGATDIILKRELPSAYGFPDPLNSLAGNTRKSPREISNIVCKQASTGTKTKNMSSFVFTWGQFIDHDITLTEEGHTEDAPIFLPPNENSFAVPIRFMRSKAKPGTGISSPREQINLITSWLDASMVYGSDQHRASWLRTYQNGKLKTSAGNLLPYNTYNGEQYGAVDPNAPSMASIPGAAPKHFVAGDVRANEQPGLTTLHTLFVREHNRYCDQLVRNGQTNDEKIYQRARKWVGALIQVVTYNEFLPALGVELPPYQGYNSYMQPDITNEFATAAYRMGHTMVTEQMVVLDHNCSFIPANTSLRGNFFNNSLIQNWGIEPILRGLANQQQEAIDVKLVDNLRTFLFQIPGAPPAGLDLAALNIQRGRDHGLPDYNTMRQHFLGQRATRFKDISSKGAIRRSLKEAYHSNINNIDAWTGLLAEDHAPNANVGPTLQAMLSMQFQRLRDGDFYYYEWDPYLTDNKKRTLRNTKLAKIIKRNTSIQSIANKLFKARNCQPNSLFGDSPEEIAYSRSEEEASTPSQALVIFPNPASETVNVNLTAYLGESIQLVLQDQLGRQVYEQSIEGVSNFRHTIEVGNWDEGIYFLSVIQPNALPLSQKLVIRRGK